MRWLTIEVRKITSFESRLLEVTTGFCVTNISDCTLVSQTDNGTHIKKNRDVAIRMVLLFDSRVSSINQVTGLALILIVIAVKIVTTYCT